MITVRIKFVLHFFFLYKRAYTVFVGNSQYLEKIFFFNIICLFSQRKCKSSVAEPVCFFTGSNKKYGYAIFSTIFH